MKAFLSRKFPIQVVKRSMHYNPDYFPEPTEMDPSRFGVSIIQSSPYPQIQMYFYHLL
ncbi:hypothetical protein Mapa_008329 [Marchantia paleacea]|nr:hypothetical protein Mapa_008329 [Marchantia paleacea]